jgi:hypothetical protein
MPRTLRGLSASPPASGQVHGRDRKGDDERDETQSKADVRESLQRPSDPSIIMSNRAPANSRICRR